MDQLIRKLLRNEDFLEFAKYVMEEVGKLDTVNGLETMTNQAAGEEAKIRLKSKEKIKEILRPFIYFKEKSEYSKEEVNKAKEKYAL